MDSPIAVGYIVQWAGPAFTPEFFLECNGQLLQISSYQGLYSIIGPTYGGDSKTTFALPDMRPTDNEGHRISYKSANVPAYIICYYGPNPVWP